MFCSFSSPTDVGSQNPPPFRAQRSRWHFVPFSNRCRTPPPLRPSVLTGTLPRVHLLRSLASSLTHHLVSDSDIICNGPSPPLVDIVLFGLSLSDLPLSFQNAFVRKRFSHPYKGCFVLLSNRCGISQSTPL